MKKTIAAILFVSMILLSAFALGEAGTANVQDTMARMLEGNARYLSEDNANASQAVRSDTAANGQHPYAVVITCSDSRVPAELIFDAGIGELFIIRTAGNVIGNYELGSIEYGAEHLQVPLVVVLGHTHCGAVEAALAGEAHGHIAEIAAEILSCLPENCDAAQAEILNIQNSIADIRTSDIIRELEAEGKVSVVGAIYDIETGEVAFLSE